jgi:hypothetical protein
MKFETPQMEDLNHKQTVKVVCRHFGMVLNDRYESNHLTLECSDGEIKKTGEVSTLSYKEISCNGKNSFFQRSSV